MKRTNRKHRLEELRLREAKGTLTEQEHAELLAIFAELDAEPFVQFQGISSAIQ